jgi:hypothetical protein
MTTRRQFLKHAAIAICGAGALQAMPDKIEMDWWPNGAAFQQPVFKPVSWANGPLTDEQVESLMDRLMQHFRDTPISAIRTELIQYSHLKANL